VFQPGGRDSFVTVDSEEGIFNGAFLQRQRMSLQIPNELIEKFVDSSGRDDGLVRTVSGVYYSVNAILPSRRPGVTDE
jgi:hypothetical protein